MAAGDLIIDDNYIVEMGSYYYKMGHTVIDKMIDQYINKMQDVKNSAVMEGDIAESLDTYIQCAQTLKNKAGEIGSDLKTLMEHFKTDIDDADQFLF